MALWSNTDAAQNKPKNLSNAEKALTFGFDGTEVSVGGDNVTSVALVQGGTKYVEAPTVAFSGGGGASAAATATIAAGAVTAITITNTGSSYETVPTVTIPKARVTIPAASITIATDTIAFTGHGLVAGDTITYNNGGGADATGLVSGTNYFVISSGLTANAFKVSLTSGGAAVDITGQGTNAQFFVIVASVAATATAAKGSGSTGTQVTHAGWVRRTVGTGGRAGRIQYETLVAMGSMTSDAADDTVAPDA